MSKKTSRKKNINLNEEAEKKHVHLILKKDRINKFESIKNKFGLSQDVDVLRTCLDIVHNSLGKEPLKVRPELLNIIESFLNNNYLKKKHFVFNINDIVNEAVHYWIQSRRSELNLHSFPFRQELTEDEQRIAMVFVEHQIDYDSGLSLEKIKSFLPNIDESRINKIIKDFLNNRLIISTTIDNITYYYAPVS